jgi:Ca2+-binding EF-hand superfamily protein
VILDATNTTKARRDEWKSNDWQTRFKVFDTKAEECIRRAKLQNNAAGQPLIDEEIIPVIERMQAKFEPLVEDELRWD